MGTQRDCRPLCQEDRPEWIDGGTLCRSASPLPGPIGGRRIQPHGVAYSMNDEVSYELRDASGICVPTSLTAISLAQMRVLDWLVQHRRKSSRRKGVSGSIAEPLQVQSHGRLS